MTTRELERSGVQAPGVAGTPPALLATEMVEAALSYCERKTEYRGRDRIAAALRDQVPHVQDYFRHALARQAAEYLSNLDDNLVAVYTHNWGDAEEEGEDRSNSLTASICLILHVRRKTAALASAIASLDEALLERYADLISPYGRKMAALLDAQVVDDRDIEDGIGFGAVVRSSYSRPIRVWSR